MKDRHPFSGLATIELLDGVRVGSGRGVETHNCRIPREHGITVSSWTGTYRFSVMKYCGVEPDEIKHGSVPILQQDQSRRDRRNSGRPYSNEEREYCVATVLVT